MIQEYGKTTKRGANTAIMKLFPVIRQFLENYFRGVRSDKYHKPSFADSVLTLWYGISEVERMSVLEMARREDYAAFENMLIKMDEEEIQKERAAKREELFSI